MPLTKRSLVALVLVLGAHTAQAQPALTEPWPKGEPVSDMEQIAGTMTAFMLGFGTGQAIQGRWRETGWIFTLGDSVATVGIVGSVMVGLSTTEVPGHVLEGVMLGSMLMSAVLRYWQTYDAAVGPRDHNRKLNAKRRRALQPAVQPMLAPIRTGDGFVGGATLRF